MLAFFTLRCAQFKSFAIMDPVMVYLVMFMIYGEVIFYIVRFCQRKSIFVAEKGILESAKNARSTIKTAF